MLRFSSGIALFSLTLVLLSNAAAVELNSARKAGDTDRVTVTFSATGKTAQEVPPQEAAADKEEAASDESFQFEASYDYLSKTRLLSAGHVVALRYYAKATATTKIGDDATTSAIPANRRFNIAETRGQNIEIFPRTGPSLPSEEALLKIPMDPLALDGFLPTGDVKVGDTWKPSDETLARAFQIEAVGVNKIECELAELTDARAMIDVAGTLEGARFGATSFFEVKARIRFNRERNRINWLGMAFNNTKGANRVEVGLEASAKMTVQILAAHKNNENFDANREAKPLTQNDPRLNLLCENSGGHWTFTHHPDWKLVKQTKDAAVLRLIRSGEFVAECHASRVLRDLRKEPMTLDDLEKEIKEKLGKRYLKTLEKKTLPLKNTNATSLLRLASVVPLTRPLDGSQGPTELPKDAPTELQMERRYYLVTGQEGRGVILIFTFDQKLTKKFDDADATLVETLTFPKK